MSVPANHLAVLNATASNLGRWLEIEGIPYAYGSFLRGADFFAARSATQQLLGIQPYLLKVPKSVDQSIDTLSGGAQSTGTVQFELGDMDGSLTQLIGVGYQTNFTALAADLTATSTTITFPSGGGAGFVNGGYCYIGTETIKIGTVNSVGGQFTGCTRGVFRSTPQAFGKGVPIGTRPYTMANRRVWYNQIGLAGQTRQSLDGASDANTCVRISGLLDDMVMNKEPNSYMLTIKSMDTELDAKVFRTLRGWALQQRIMSGLGFAETSGGDLGAGQIQVAGYPGYSTFTWNGVTSANNRDYAPPLAPDGSQLVASGETILVRIDDEIFTLKGMADGMVQFTERALLGTKPALHSRGAWIQEIVALVEYAPSTNFELSAKFSAVCPTDVHADHPLAIVLQILMSSGTVATNGAYDVLPKDWGLNIPAIRVNVAEIETGMLEEPSLRFGGIIQQPTNFVALMRELLAFSGYYYFVDIGDVFRIRRLRPPEPDANAGVRVIDDSQRIRGYRPIWEANWTGAVRQVTFKYSYDILRSNFKIIDIFKLGGGDLYSKGKARDLEYDSTMVYPGKTGVPGEPSLQRFDIHQWLITRAEFINRRYSRPPGIIHERITYANIDVAIGDIVLITDPNVPNTATGVLGVTNELGEVISKSIDDDAKVVTLTVLLTGWQLGTYRYIAPSVEIIARTALGAGTATVQLAANSFTDPTGPTGLPQTDLLLDTINGTQPCAFSGGALIDAILWNADFTAHQDIQISLFNFGTPNILNIQTASGGAWTFNPAAGMFITSPKHADVYGNQDIQGIETLTDKYAFGADSSDLLTNAQKANLYFPT